MESHLEKKKSERRFILHCSSLVQMQAVVLVPTVETLSALFDTAAQNLLLVCFFLKVRDD